MLNEFTYKVLVVSSNNRFNDALKTLLSPERFSPVKFEDSASSARRLLLSSDFDIVVINTPLQDEFGIDLAIDIASDSNSGVLLLIKSEIVEEISYNTEDYGILTVAKPMTKQAVIQALQLLCATRKRVMKMEEKVHSFEEKLNDIKVVNRAKMLLMENLKMTENEAHKFIERTAMDSRSTKRDVANKIINEYKLP